MLPPRKSYWESIDVSGIVKAEWWGMKSMSLDLNIFIFGLLKGLYMGLLTWQYYKKIFTLSYIFYIGTSEILKRELQAEILFQIGMNFNGKEVWLIW